MLLRRHAGADGDGPMETVQRFRFKGQRKLDYARVDFQPLTSNRFSKNWASLSTGNFVMAYEGKRNAAFATSVMVVFREISMRFPLFDSGQRMCAMKMCMDLSVGGSLEEVVGMRYEIMVLSLRTERKSMSDLTFG